ncbi:MAG: ABC transporter substrate-binding protein [Caldilineaceae bacterium]|nr:ABC transporter substrate-binding protein [Caldilineaceae bacterium]
MRQLSKQLLLIALVGLLLLSACAAPPAQPMAATPTPVVEGDAAAALFPLTITDATGQEFTFDAPPKIGCYWYGCYEAFADLGIPFYAGSLAPEELASVFYAPAGPPAQIIADDSNPEEWAAAEIDLFVTRVPDSADLDAMRQAAPIFFLHHPSYGESDQQGYAAYYQNLRLLGALSGQPEAAEAAIARFETVLANLKALSTPETEALNIAVVFSGDGYQVISPDNPFCAAVAEVGLGHCVGEGAATWEVSAESFLALDPDWIVYAGFGQSYQDRTDPVWTQLTAVKEGRVFDAAGSRYYCCSTRGLINALQDYVSHLLPAAGIPNPGSEIDFDPLQSPLVQSAESTATTAATTAAATACDAGFRLFADDMLVGDPVCIPENPQRIAYLLYASYLYPFGVKPIASFGLERDSTNFPALAAWINDGVTGIDLQPNLEQLAALQPDLQIFDASRVAGMEPLLANIAPLVLFNDFSDDLTMARRHRFNGRVLGQEALAEEQLANYDQRVAELRTALAEKLGSLADIKVSMARFRSTEEFDVMDRYGNAAEILDVLGFGRPAAIDYTPEEILEVYGPGPWEGATGLMGVSKERLDLLEGDYLIVIASTGGANNQQGSGNAIIDALAQDPLWNSLGVVQAERVYVRPDAWLQAGGSYYAAQLLLDDLAGIFEVTIPTPNPVTVNP